MIHLANCFISAVDRLTEFTGRLVSWLTIVMIAVVLIVVITRYFLQIGSIAAQESITYLHATIFLLGIAYTLKRDGHVRVDIFYRKFSVRQKALVDACGGLFFLVPVSGLIFYSSWDYVLTSWSIGERSTENNGLPFVYLLKTLMLVMPATLFLQGVSEIFKNMLILSAQLDSDNGNTLDKASVKYESMP